MRNDRERLLDIREAIERIGKKTTAGRDDFESSDLVQVWVLRHLQVIGEASRGLSDDFRGRHPEVAWSEIIGTRNILVHAYFDIDLDITWSVVEKDLPVLKNQVQAMLDELPED